MKGILLLRDYFIELASGFLSIVFLLLDFLGIVLLFWPGFLWAQVVGLVIFAFGFVASNFRIYWRQRQLLSNSESQVAKRIHLLHSLLNEIQTNLTCTQKANISELSDDVWQRSRDNIYWLPITLQEQTLTHYRALHLLLSAMHDGIQYGLLADSCNEFPSQKAEVWSRNLADLIRSFEQSFQELPQALQEQIKSLEENK